MCSFVSVPPCSKFAVACRLAACSAVSRTLGYADIILAPAYFRPRLMNKIHMSNLRLNRHG